jgi:hypothetical protein
MIVGQDWGDQRAFEKQSGRDEPGSATNQMLRKLMASAGIDVPRNPEGESSGIFLTNAVLCFRQDGGCQGPVQSNWFINCGLRFLIPQICLGQRSYAAVLAAYQLPAIRNWRDVVEGPGITLPCGSLVFGVYHCGQRILNTHRHGAAQHQDWQRIGFALKAKSG